MLGTEAVLKLQKPIGVYKYFVDVTDDTASLASPDQTVKVVDFTNAPGTLHCGTLAKADALCDTDDPR